jgi:hypothetical protein
VSGGQEGQHRPYLEEIGKEQKPYLEAQTTTLTISGGIDRQQITPSGTKLEVFGIRSTNKGIKPFQCCADVQ